MLALSDDFSAVLHVIGLDGIRHPIFYHAPAGIRFEIGGTEDVYSAGKRHKNLRPNPAYLSSATRKAQTIYAHLPAPPDILRIDGYPDERTGDRDIVAAVCSVTGMPQPHEQILNNFLWSEEDEGVSQLQLYWNIKKSAFSPHRILREVVRADIGGYSGLVSSVYFADTSNAVLFHLYDDRGADVVAANKETIRPLFEQYNQWILDYDRDSINRLFAT